MKPTKPIERLFQENLKDFQASPSPKLWDSIEAQLYHKHQRKRVLPLWWQVASVAAILVLFASIGLFYYNTSGSKSSANAFTFNKRSYSTPLEISVPTYRFSSVHEELTLFENSIASRFDYEIKTEQQDNTQINPRSTIRMAQTPVTPINRLANPQISESDITPQSALLFGNEAITSNQQPRKPLKKSIFNDIEEEASFDFDTETTTAKSWIIQPNIAPVFMSSLSGGNPIESGLQGETSSNPNMSYGLNVAFAINKRIKIRTGVNQVAMGYNTQDVVLSTTSGALRGEAGYPKNPVVEQVRLISASEVARKPVNMATSFSRLNTINYSSVGSVSHELGFLEIPLEVEYAIINRKLGIHLLGGASTYLVNDNEVFFLADGSSSSLGASENLNNFSFSANFGLGMDYKFSKRFSFNFEPKFLYQINTFQDNGSGFQPYFFGIYSGIQFKF